MAKSLRREFAQLADTYNPAKHKIAGWYISAKLDGCKAIWDGGITRGMPTRSVPWASVTDPKTGLAKAKVKPLATGLWSRYANPIVAPDWFLNSLPACPLDGELWAGVGNFQLCRSICGGDEPDDRFDQISFAVYSSPALTSLFATGEIKNANHVCTIDEGQIEEFVKGRLQDFEGDYKFVMPAGTFDDELAFLQGAIETQSDNCFLHQQMKLPNDEDGAKAAAEAFLSKVLDGGGEGCVIRDPNAVWTPRRHKGLLKWKPYTDGDGRLVGFTSGRKTDKGSKLLGKIGALILDYEGKRLELAGLTDAEREFSTGLESEYAADNPGKDMPAQFQGKHFKVGDTISFLYRELSDIGIPKEARYFRQRGDT